jgi:hypothetical protein
MATPSAAILCSLLALFMWAPVGFLIARRLPLERDLRLAAAPVLGWAVQHAAALNVAVASGFTSTTVLAATAAVALAAILIPARTPARPDAPAAPSLPLWILAAAALVAIGPAIGVLPKILPDGVALADPLYDHTKIALVDEIVRTGVPPANPFIGTADGGPGHVAYYYYWLFGAAELALLTGANGWEADAAATWYTGFASLALMCGLAFRLSGGGMELKPAKSGFRAASALFVLAAASSGSLRMVIEMLAGQEGMDAALERGTGLAGWFFQTSWSPHHVASAAAAVLAIVLMERLARTPSVTTALILGLLAAAGFGSSLWVGGITFALCAGAAGAMLLVSAKPGNRLSFVAVLAIAAGVTVALVFPLLDAQLHAAAERGNGSPVLISAYPVLGPAVPADLRRWLDIPAYWLIVLPIEFPAAWLLGACFLGEGLVKDLAARIERSDLRDGRRVLRSKYNPAPPPDVASLDPGYRLAARRLMPPLAAAAIASLCCGWLLVSAAGGDNNDLGWRAILPGLLILTACAGAGFAQFLARRQVIAAIAGVALLGLALPDGTRLLHDNIAGRLSTDAARFRDAPALWAAARRHTAPDERIASNPHLTDSLTRWPISLSWALLSDRRSCFAGEELALAFSSLPPEARARASGLFDRVFAGAGSAADLETLVHGFDCKVIVLTPQDGAWRRDPFAESRLFTNIEQADGWRIYRAGR